MLFKRAAAVLAMVFGIVGMACCLAGAYGVRLLESRLDRANDKVFEAVDRRLEAVQDRMPIVQQRIRELKVTTTEVTDAILEWGAKKGQDRIVWQLQIESRIENLSGHLRATELRLEASGELIRAVRQVLEVAQGFGAKVNPASTDAVQEFLVSLQVMLQQAEQVVDGVRKFASPTSGDPVEDRQAQVAKVLAGILLTLSDVDRRLDDFVVRLSEVQAEARQGKAKTSHYVVLGSVLGYGLLAWGASGQAALSWWGWNCFRRDRLPGKTAE